MCGNQGYDREIPSAIQYHILKSPLLPPRHTLIDRILEIGYNLIVLR